MKSKKDGFLLRLSRRLMSGDTSAELQREIDFMRGYLAGCTDLVTIPERLAVHLERHARNAYETAAFEHLQAEEEHSPYE